MNEKEDIDSEKKEAPAKGTIVDIIFDGLMWVYDKFINLVRLNADDPIWLGFFKIIARAIGILIAVALSPFIIIGIIVSILVVS